MMDKSLINEVVDFVQRDIAHFQNQWDEFCKWADTSAASIKQCLDNPQQYEWMKRKRRQGEEIRNRRRAIAEKITALCPIRPTPKPLEEFINQCFDEHLELDPKEALRLAESEFEAHKKSEARREKRNKPKREKLNKELSALVESSEGMPPEDWHFWDGLYLEYFNFDNEVHSFWAPDKIVNPVAMCFQNSRPHRGATDDAQKQNLLIDSVRFSVINDCQKLDITDGTVIWQGPNTSTPRKECEYLQIGGPKGFVQGLWANLNKTDSGKIRRTLEKALTNARKLPAAPEKPKDLITLEVAVKKYVVSRSTLKRAIDDDRLTSYRRKGCAKNAKHQVSEAAVGGLWPKT